MSFGSQLLKTAILLIVLSVTVLAGEPPIMQVRVSVDNASVPHALRAAGFDVVHFAADEADVFGPAEDMDRLRDAGFRFEVIHEDVEAFYASRLETDESMGGYKTLAEIYAYLDDMKAAHSGIMTDRISIGQSLEGRDIFAVKISDNPGVDEEEPELLFTSLVHAREVITPEVLLYFMDHVTDNYGSDPEATYIVDNRELWFVLVINPDGYYYNEVTNPEGGGMWRKNRRDNLDGTFGVDLNRNFGYGWAADNFSASPITSSEGYRGTAGFSEPETQVIRDFCNTREFVLELNYHSYANAIVHPPGYDAYSVTPDQGLFESLIDSLRKENPHMTYNAYWGCGNHEDWSYGEQTTKGKTLSFLFEIGDWNDGFWPELDRIPELVSDNLGGNLVACRVADYVYTLAAPKSPVIDLHTDPQSGDFTVSWSHSDADNPAVAYELVEYQTVGTIIDSADAFDDWTNKLFCTDRTNYHSSRSSFRLCYFQGGIILNEPIFIEGDEMMTFWADYTLEDGYTYIYVEVSADGYNFVSIPGNITTTDDPHGYNLGHGITGASGGWIEAQFDLSQFAGQSIWVRVIGRAGWEDPEVWPPLEEVALFYIDDIFVVEKYETGTIIASDLTDTEYDFTGKAEGDYYYRVRAVDADGQWGEFSTFDRVAVSGGTSYVCGDANGDGVVTQADVGFLIDYLHKDGPAPDPLEAGDANGDGVVDKYDAKYLVEYLHKDGPEPVCP